jgi:hypothetical protein
MKYIPLLTAVSLISLCAKAETAEPRSCDIRVEFGSFEIGIDSETYRAVSTMLDRDPRIAERHVEALQPMGERVLCVVTEPGAQDSVYEDLRQMIPPESREGWVAVTGRDGKTYRNRWPEAWEPRRGFGN